MHQCTFQESFNFIQTVIISFQWIDINWSNWKHSFYSIFTCGRRLDLLEIFFKKFITIKRKPLKNSSSEYILCVCLPCEFVNVTGTRYGLYTYVRIYIYSPEYFINQWMNDVEKKKTNGSEPFFFSLCYYTKLRLVFCLFYSWFSSTRTYIWRHRKFEI